MNPITLLREASRRFPKLNYAWALVGVGAASATIASLFKKPQFAVPVIVFAIAGMFLLALFSKWASSRESGKPVSIPAQVLVWVCVLAFSFILFAVLSAAAFGKPVKLAERLFGDTTGPIAQPGSKADESTQAKPPPISEPPRSHSKTSDADLKVPQQIPPLDNRQRVAAQDYLIAAQQLSEAKKRNISADLSIAESQLRTAEERLRAAGIDKNHPAIKEMVLGLK